MKNPTQLKTSSAFPGDVSGGQDSATPREFLQHLPDWIQSHPEFRAMKSALRHTLKVIAGKCDKPDAAGNLLGGFVDHQMLARAGCSKATLWRHVAALEASGFVVTINRGGGRLANVLGVPGRPGALDAARVERRQSRWGKGGAMPTRYTPDALTERLAEGGALVSQNETLTDAPLVSQNETAPVSICDGTRLKMRRHPSQNATLPSPLGHPPEPNPHTTTGGAGVCVEPPAGASGAATPPAAPGAPAAPDKLVGALAGYGFGPAEVAAMIQQRGRQYVADVYRLAKHKQREGKLGSGMGFIRHCIANGADFTELPTRKREKYPPGIQPRRMTADEWAGIGRYTNPSDRPDFAASQRELAREAGAA